MNQNKNTVSPDQVADFLIVVCRERGDVLTNLKLQKLLYYAQSWFLALKKKAIFEEDFQAWVHGPVLPSQYHRFKHSEWRPIMDEVTKPQLEKILNVHLIEVVDVFGIETAESLELMTHSEAPWKNARKNLSNDEPSSEVIRKDIMREYYSSL